MSLTFESISVVRPLEKGQIVDVLNTPAIDVVQKVGQYVLGVYRNIEEHMPEGGNNVDRALLLGHELGPLYVRPRFSRNDPNGEPVLDLTPKIRTIAHCEEAESIRAQIRLNGGKVKGHHDQRTWIGKYLEAFGLDELPTLIDLFRKDTRPRAYPGTRKLSLVGSHRRMAPEERYSPAMVAAAARHGMTLDEVYTNPNCRPCVLPITIVNGIRNNEGQEAANAIIDAMLTSPSEYPPLRTILRKMIAPEFRKQTSFHRAKNKSSTEN